MTLDEYEALLRAEREFDHEHIATSDEIFFSGYNKGLEYALDAFKKVFRNPLPVVATMVRVEQEDGSTGLLMIRRALKDGYGKLALPGGFQNRGETWQEAGAREVLEETGVNIHPQTLKVVSVATVAGGNINLMIARCNSTVSPQNFKLFQETQRADGEVLEVVVIKEPVETAFAVHTEAVKNWFKWDAIIRGYEHGSDM